MSEKSMPREQGGSVEQWIEQHPFLSGVAASWLALSPMLVIVGIALVVEAL